MTINGNGILMDLKSPKIMGILNLTEDSFYDGGKYTTQDKILQRVEDMISQGVDIIDVGGQSTRPNSIFINFDDELKIVIPAVKNIKKNFPNVILSIDTFWSEVAQQTVNEGVAIVNDVSGGRIDDKMFQIVGNLKVPYVLMHSRGTPQNMQQLTDYTNITTEINSYFYNSVLKLREFGVQDVILDPGFGFAKKIEDNFKLIHSIDLLGFEKFPILAGISRKSFIYKSLYKTPDEVLIESSALNLLLLRKGVSIIRTHDVKETKNVVELHEKLISEKN